MEYEQAACAFLKEVVQGNKLMKRIKDAAEGNSGKILIMLRNNNYAYYSNVISNFIILYP